MYKNHCIFAIAPAYNEQAKIGEVVRRTPMDIVDLMIVVDDGSTDRTGSVAAAAGAHVVRFDTVRGVGAAIRAGYRLAQERGADIAVTLAGNNKDAPEEIPRLLDPICDSDCDFVMGSRYLASGSYGGDMPAYRKVATRLHPLLVSLLTGHRVTESTNGFRALNVSVLDDPRIELDQAWLDGYELEVYLLMKLLKLGWRTAEVPATKIYPPRQVGNTKMRPFVDWWNMLRPILLVGLGIRK